MAGLGAVLVLLGPMVLREPVGQGDWNKQVDPVHRRVASTMVGEPMRAGVVSVVPLFARVPSEAGHAWKDGPAWSHREVSGRLLFEDGRYYLRILNPAPRPICIAAGTVFASPQGHEVFIARDAVVPAEFAALFPAWTNQSPENVAATEDVVYRRAGLATPAATGVLLHETGDFAATVLADWRRNGRATFRGVSEGRGVQDLSRRLERATRPLAEMLDRTAVGAVFLIANRPVAAHVFGTHELFLAALPELLQGVAIQARAAIRRAGGEGALLQLGRFGDARGRALAFLRGSLRGENEWAESYGEGFDVIARDENDRVLGHAIVDHRNRVFHAAYLRLGGYWPGQKGQANPIGPAGPSPPDGGGNETPPGVSERKPRPSAAEQRRTDRVPRR